MANKRILKKEISRTAGSLFSEALFCALYIPGTDKEKADKLMTRILDMQDDFICRVGKTDGKENPALVKSYYKKLKAELQAEINDIAKAISELNQ
ncbi:hypothetical protein B5F77_05210 [Parabacteroides sp. An277]|uniref:hypothetical protein n=1 Tax=Parabacteroides sp. An277 TaxID=1965619 RepID=UPI000B38CCB7|nr:hypothetical protein [Parabacteroides sp. An277]OUO53727.1 hypothetical protein B5F77_05210 [Parabacteroides sp. An277]